MPSTIDELSIPEQQIVSALLEAPGAQYPAAELVDRTFVEDVDELFDYTDGMVGITDTDPFIDATTGEEHTHVRLTDAGKEWASSRESSLAPPVTVEGAFERIDRLSERVNELERRLSALEQSSES